MDISPLLVLASESPTLPGRRITRPSWIARLATNQKVEYSNHPRRAIFPSKTGFLSVPAGNIGPPV